MHVHARRFVPVEDCVQLILGELFVTIDIDRICLRTHRKSKGAETAVTPCERNR